MSYGTSVNIKANNWRILCDYAQYPLKSWQEKRFPSVTFFSPSVSFMRIIFVYPKSIQNYIKHGKMMISCDLTKCSTQLFAVLRMRISFFGKIECLFVDDFSLSILYKQLLHFPHIPKSSAIVYTFKYLPYLSKLVAFSLTSVLWLLKW